mmetsp:Transcript_10195/g.32313  ORF Transcript_10195/g.32313 Transcript_10195/m.32313 type:complete len:340 (+) Transcript_10195:2352-3371(+)
MLRDDVALPRHVLAGRNDAAHHKQALQRIELTNHLGASQWVFRRHRHWAGRCRGCGSCSRGSIRPLVTGCRRSRRRRGRRDATARRRRRAVAANGCSCIKLRGRGVAAARRVDEAHAQLKHVLGDWRHVEKVAVAAARAGASLVLATGSLVKVDDVRVLGDDGATVKVAAGEAKEGLGRARLIVKLGKDVAQQVISDVVAHVQLFNFSVPGKLNIHVNVKVVKVALALKGVDPVAGTRRTARRPAGATGAGVVGRARVAVGGAAGAVNGKEAGEEEGPGDEWTSVQARAAGAVAARANLNVEGTVNLVLFGAKDGAKWRSRRWRCCRVAGRFATVRRAI